MFTAWRPFLCSTWSSQRTDIRRGNGQASSPKGTNSKWGSMVFQFFLLYSNDSFDTYATRSLCLATIECGCWSRFCVCVGVWYKKYVWSVWWSCLGLKGPDWLQLIYVCVGVRLVETGACNLCFFSIRNETKTNWIQTTTFQLSKKGFIGRGLKLATPTHKFRTRKVIFSGPLKTKFRIYVLDNIPLPYLRLSPKETFLTP